MVCRAVCIMLDVKPQRIPDPADPTKRIMDYWGPSQKTLADNQFINNLMNYDKVQNASTHIYLLSDYVSTYLAYYNSYLLCNRIT